MDMVNCPQDAKLELKYYIKQLQKVYCSYLLRSNLVPRNGEKPQETLLVGPLPLDCMI